MPTGGGKSAVYQVPALLLDGPTVVISPLIALQRDQVAALDASGDAGGAVAVNSAQSAGAARPRSRRSRAGEAGVPLPLARAARQARDVDAARRGRALAVRRRRGALRLLLGPRLPARLPAARPGHRAPGPPAGGRADRDRLAARTRGHRRRARPARTSGRSSAGFDRPNSRLEVRAVTARTTAKRRALVADARRAAPGSASSTSPPAGTPRSTPTS